MPQKVINVGPAANSRTGDSLRNAFIKINDNFNEVYVALGGDLSPKLPLTGGTLTGYLTLNADPVELLQAATKQYVDSEISNITLGDLVVDINRLSTANINEDLILDPQGRIKVPNTLYQGNAYDNIEYPNSLTAIRVDADEPTYTQILYKNHNAGSVATGDLMIFNDQGNLLGDNNYVDLGINSSNYAEPPYGIHTPGSGYLFTKGVDLFVGTTQPGTKLVFHAGGTSETDSGAELDAYTWRFNRSVQTIVGTPGPLNFTVWNTRYDAGSTSVYQSINDANNIAHFGIRSSHPNSIDGNIGPNEVFLHGEGAGNTTHIGNRTNLNLYSDEVNGFAGDPTLSLSKTDQTATFRANVVITGGLIINRSAPTSSKGASGDLEGMIAVNRDYIYYCTANYAETGHQVTNVHPPEGAGIPYQYTWIGYESDIQALIALGDLTGYTVEQSGYPSDTRTVIGMRALGGSLGIEVDGPLYFGGGNVLTFTSPDYLPPPDIWKRVQWSNDTW